MQLTSRQIEAVTVLAPLGELTVTTAPAFVRQTRLIRAPAAEPLVAVDLSGVRRIDSSGYAALVTLLRDVQRRGGQVCLAGLDHEARLLLEIMRLHLLFDVCEDVPSALETLTAARAGAAAAAEPRRRVGRVRFGPGSLAPRAS